MANKSGFAGRCSGLPSLRSLRDWRFAARVPKAEGGPPARTGQVKDPGEKLQKGSSALAGRKRHLWLQHEYRGAFLRTQQGQCSSDLGPYYQQLNSCLNESSHRAECTAKETSVSVSGVRHFLRTDRVRASKIEVSEGAALKPVAGFVARSPLRI